MVRVFKKKKYFNIYLYEKVVGLHASVNNQASTVLDLFLCVDEVCIWNILASLW